MTSTTPGAESTITLRSHFVEVGHGNVSGVVAVVLVRLGEAVHVQQLPVCHLPVGIKYLLAFRDGAHANHLQTVLREEENTIREEKNMVSRQVHE